MVVTVNLGAILAALGAIAGGIGAGSVIWLKFLRPVSQPMRELLAWLQAFREDWDGTADRPGVSGRPGMMVRMAALESEFRPNGGGSLRDRVDSIERRQLTYEGGERGNGAAATERQAA